MTKNPYGYTYSPPALHFLGSRVVRTNASPTGLAVVLEASDETLNETRRATGQERLLFRDWLPFFDQRGKESLILTECDLMKKMLARHQAGEYLALYEQAKQAGRYEILSYNASPDEEQDASKIYY